MLKTYRTTWGVQSESWETLFPYLKEQGFSGIEASLLDIGFPNADRFLNLLKKHDLSWICGAYSNWDNYAGVPRRKPVSEHVEQLRGQLKGALALDPKPVRINCHSGSDDFSEDEAREYFTAAVAMEKELGGGVPICHETHRGRILYSPYVALRVVKEFPSMKFTLDLSHWVVVTERTIPLEVLRPIVDRTWHIHARVGSPQHAQVADPTTSKFTPYFQEIWEACWKAAATSGRPPVTLDPEYGPTEDLYMPDAICVDGKYLPAEDRHLHELVVKEHHRQQAAFKAFLASNK